MITNNVPEFARIVVLVATLVALTAVVQTLYSDVSRGRPFWPNFWRSAAFDLLGYTALGGIVTLMIWAIP